MRPTRSQRHELIDLACCRKSMLLTDLVRRYPGCWIVREDLFHELLVVLLTQPQLPDGTAPRGDAWEGRAYGLFRKILRCLAYRWTSREARYVSLPDPFTRA